MAKAVGNTGHIRYSEQRLDVAAFLELARKLEHLARAQEAARTIALDEDPDYGAAFEQLFVAVALLNPLNATAEIQKLARWNYGVMAKPKA